MEKYSKKCQKETTDINKTLFYYWIYDILADSACEILWEPITSHTAQPPFCAVVCYKL